MTLHLANDRIALDLAPAFGARITALTDHATGRQWLVPGPCEGDAGDRAAYRGREARGWDECYPTVGPCDHPDWGALRDHGLLWGRPWEVTPHPDGAGCSARYRDARSDFTRALRLSGPVLRADYAVTNQGERPFAWLWCQHALLATTPRDRIALEGMGPMQAEGRPLDWPDRQGRDLTRIGPLSEGLRLKAHAPTPLGATARIHGPDGGLALHWGADVPAFGLWLSYGGWPDAAAPLHQVALEPATGCADDLAAAEALGQAKRLSPGETHRWTVTLTLSGPSSPDPSP